jgi:hypothetical protein
MTSVKGLARDKSKNGGLPSFFQMTVCRINKGSIREYICLIISRYPVSFLKICTPLKYSMEQMDNPVNKYVNQLLKAPASFKYR